MTEIMLMGVEATKNLLGTACIQLSKYSSMDPVCLTDEEKARIAFLLLEIDQNENEFVQNTEDKNTVQENAFMLSADEKSKMENVNNKLVNIQRAENEYQPRENHLTMEDNNHNWKKFFLLRRLRQIDHELEKLHVETEHSDPSV